MPKKGYKKYYKKRRNMPLSKAQTKAVGKIAWKEVHKDSELKTYEDNSITDLQAIASATPKVYRVAMPAQGLGVNDRIGEQISVRSLEINGDIDCGSAVTTHARVIVAQCLESDVDGHLTDEDVLQQTQPNQVNSFYRVNGNMKYRVLSDRHFYWDSNTASAPQPYRLKLKKLPINKIQLDNTGVQGNIGGLYVYAFTEDTGGNTDIRQMQCRIRYYDM